MQAGPILVLIRLCLFIVNCIIKSISNAAEVMERRVRAHQRLPIVVSRVNVGIKYR